MSARLRRPASARVAVAMLIAASIGARAACAAPDLFVSFPTVIAQRGAVVQIPIDLSRSVDTLGVYAIQYTLPIDPAFVSSASILPGGLMTSWGTPFSNVTSTMVSVAAAGASPITSTATRLQTLQFTVSATAPINQAMPLSCSTMKFNETHPVIQETFGALIIRSGTADVSDANGPARLEISPNPARAGTRLSYAVTGSPGGAPLTLEIFGLDGRRLRVLRQEFAVPGSGEVRWDGADATGRRAPPGLYLARLRYGSLERVRRFVVIE
jgi:hypothetical protein